MSFARAVTTVAGLTMVSRVLGFIREMLVAAMLGATSIADAFFVALTLPNVFRRLFAEGAFSVTFVPLFALILLAPALPAGAADHAKTTAELELSRLKSPDARQYAPGSI